MNHNAIRGRMTAIVGAAQSMQATPRIVLLPEADRGFGRGMLSGIARYSALNGPWTFYRKPPGYRAASEVAGLTSGTETK